MASRIASLPPGFRALVTGSSGAIGGATCQRLLDAGARVFGLDARHQESGDLLACEHFTEVRLDRYEAMSDERAIAAALRAAGALDATEGQSLHALICVAGGNPPEGDDNSDYSAPARGRCAAAG